MEFMSNLVTYYIPSLLILMILLQWFVLEKTTFNIKKIVEVINEFVAWITTKKSKITLICITVVYILALFLFKYLL